MSTLLSIQSVSKSFGSKSLFEDLSFTICENDRIGLIGPNGVGKSSLLKILAGEDDPDEGIIAKRQSLKIGYSSQSPDFPSLSLEGVLISQPSSLTDIEKLTRARILLGKAQFTDFTQNASLLSGGWKKRLDIIRALMPEPDLLLLDEPTNHLDLEGILWLEKFLMRERLTCLLVSHDRYFLNNVPSKIIEINPCYPSGLFISDGSMRQFSVHKEAFLEGQLEQERSLRLTVRDEVEWLRKSPKARTTKSVARIQRAHALLEELSHLKKRNTTSNVGITFNASERETRKLIVANNVTKTIEGKPLFKGINITLSPGTRLGVLGKNGTGKTTLLKILAKMVDYDMGTVKYADDLRLVYFDQHREKVPSHLSLREALCPTGETVTYQGQTIHVNGWAKRFLFPTDCLDMPVGALSGGERARILLAQLMLKPADVLFLDEPTNDLDIATLEIMEKSLREFPGAVVLISHDRCLMDNVCTQLLVLGTNQEQEFFSDYTQWERSQPKSAPVKEEVKNIAPSAPKPIKLSYKEQKELDSLPEKIHLLEEEIASLTAEAESSSKPALEVYRLIGEKQDLLDAAYARWQELEDKKSSFN